MKIQNFSKYEVLGNDFIIIDELIRIKPVEFVIMPTLSVNQRIKLCNRNFGIGADGILTLFSTHFGGYYLHITNADGSIASMCGNGLICVITWIVTKKKLMYIVVVFYVIQV